ncbi:hypothetical protein E1B28_011182 [Marasmius oreades]|uniref:F-box domain-containing protein n=1 Tax=Marasmius oreades TaxID=181124 RepID=A0A9P7RUX5_9AGAR|nr:uncharacterized protein E1B28_011182 [Marasmius oreades]KAG7089503.1 hypothetical protein E1B28_011182 [Marasmius oreades]
MATPLASRLLDFPTEILLSIFAEVSTIGPRTDVASKNLCSFSQAPGAEPTLPSPLNIASVCQRWREIALEDPELWSSFSISLDSKRFASPLTLQWFELYVARSKETGITIRVHGWYHDDYSYSRELNTFMNVLGSSIDSWKELDVTAAALPAGWDTMAKSFFQLLDATVCAHYSDGIGVQHAPQSHLRSLIINEPPYLPAKPPPSSFATERSHLEVHFQHLTSLTIVSQLHFHRLWYCGILSRCSSTLTDLTIELLGVPDSGPFCRWNVLPVLRSLTVIIKWRKGNPQDALALIFSALVCPSLKRMEVRVETEFPCATTRGQWPGPEIVDFLTARFLEDPKADLDELCNAKISGLKEIVLINVVITAQEMKDLIQAAPGSKIVVCQQICDGNAYRFEDG